MNMEQLKCCIECDPFLRDTVIGVYAADRLPKLDRFPAGFLANTDIRSKPEFQQREEIPLLGVVRFHLENEDR